MPELRFAYSIQSWLETAPQGYLDRTIYGHAAGECEPAGVLGNETVREEAVRTTVQLVVGERCALAASSGLINATPSEASKRFLATQTLDEARHVEIFTQRLVDLGVAPADLDTVIRDLANPNLVKFAGVLLERIHKGDFIAGIVGQNIILEGIALSVFETMREASVETNPKLAHTLVGTIADERRHVGFGEATIGKLVGRHPEKIPDLERMQKELAHYILAAFGDIFGENRATAKKRRRGGGAARDDDPTLQDALTRRLVSRFKTKLERIGIRYQAP